MRLILWRRPRRVGYRVGEENRGLEYMFVLMNQARLGVAIEGVGLAERAYQNALAHARTRVQGRLARRESGKRVTLIQHPDVRRMLLAMRARTEAMRGLAYIVAATLDAARHHPDGRERRRAGALNGLLTPVIKGWCTEQCIGVASTGIQIFGGAGFIEDTGAAQLLRDARVTTIYEGTTGIQAVDLTARKIAWDGGATALELIAELRNVQTALARADFMEAKSIERCYAEAVGALASATAWVIETVPRERNAVMAVAVPYLELWGTVLGGWVMARAALIAGRRVARDADAAFYRGKLATARFYAEHVLCHADALAREVTAGADSVLDATPSFF